MKRMKRLLTALLAVLMLATAAPVMTASAEQTNGDYKLLAVTFDDGPGKYTAQLLDGLARLNVKATFFMLGECIVKYPDLPARMVAEGHQIANHSYDHPTLSSGNISSQVGRTRELLVRYGGDQTYYVRAPYGSDSARAYFKAPSIYWSMDTRDWQHRDSSYVSQYIIENAKDGDIILLHDIHETSVTGALTAIETLQKQGYEFVTVSELFRRRGVEVQNGVRYTSAPNRGINLGPLEEEEPDPEYFDESKLSEHWAYGAIEYVLKNGLFLGTDEGFLPNHKMTRAMFLTVLGRIAGVSSEAPESVPFSDVPVEHWAAPYIAWAAEDGIIDTDSETFDLDANIPREDMAKVIYQYLKYTGLAGETEDTNLPYADAEEISPSALDGVKYCTAISLLVGDGLNFNPKDGTTRAEAATLFMRLDKFIFALEHPDNEEDAEGPGQETDPEPERNPMVVVIDPGHQGKGNSAPEPIGPGASKTKAKVSSGTQGRYTRVPEHQVNLEVALLLRDELESRGYTVILTRESPDVNISNAERAAIANEAHADAFVRLHCDGSEDPSVQGAFTICPTPGNPYPIVGLYKECRLLAEQVLAGLAEATGGRTRKIWETDTMSGLNWCEVPSVIVEMGYMTNRAEDTALVSPEYQAKLARGMADGIERYFALLEQTL